MSGLQNYQEALKNNEPIFRTRTQTGLKSGLTEQPQAPLILRTETFQGTLKTTAQKAEESESPAPVLDHAVYFNRMLENSLDKNLALKVRQDRELKQSGWNDIERIARGSFTQKHPTAKKDRLFGSSENAQIKMAKQTFRNADLCTVRELSALTRYFNTHGLQENPAEGAADQVNDAVLSQYVRSLLDYSLDQRNLTDEYLSENITQVYDYSRRLSRYEALKQAYPKFFAALPETQKISLETRAASSAPLSELLNTHIKLHGIQLTEGKNGKTAVSLWRENADKTTRHREREERQRAYDEKLKAFVRTSFDERNLNIAKRLTESPLLNEADSLVQELEKILAENKDASELFKLQIDAALQEIKKAGSVRESLLLSQKENLSAYNAGKPEAYGQIKQINRKLVLCAKHIENYKQYLYFLNGNNETVSKSLAQFLIREKHEELLEPVKIRTTLNCLREGAAVNERRALREELKELLEEKKKKAKAAGTLKQKKGRSKTGAEQNPPAKEDIRIAEIKSRLSLKFVPPTVSREEFYESMRVYNKGQEEAAEYKKQKADGNKRKEEIAKRAAKYAADHGLVNPETNTRISPLIMDPGSEWLSDDDLLYFYVATRYEPTEATSEAVRKELYEKGLKPHIDTFLNLKPEDFKSFVPGEDLTFHDRDFWKKRTFVNIGMDMANFLDVLKRNDISLTDDEYVKLRSSGKLMEGIMTDYRTYGNTVIDPLWKVVKKEAKLYEGDVAVDMHNYVFGPDADDEETDEDVRNFLKKYSEEATGYKAERGVEDSENTMEPVAEHADNYVTNIFTELAAGTGNMDYAAAYKRREDNIRAEILQKKDTLAKEKEQMKPYFAEVTDEAAEVRLMLKNEDKALALRMTGGNASKWKEGDGDIRAFQRLLKPVEIDANGSVQAAYRENALENGRDSADFLAGGVRRENVIRKFALDAIHIEFTEEMLKPAYIRDHFPEMHEKIGRLESFRKLSKDYGAFLESSAFSEDEKKAIRLKVTDNRYLDTLSAIETYSRMYVGIDGNGKEIERKDLKTDAEKAAWNADRLKQVEAALEGMAGVLSEDIAKQKRMETLYETQGDLINRLNEDYSVIYEKDLDFKRRKAGLEAESKTVDEELEAIRKQIDAEKDKQKLQELYTKQRACFKRKNEISAKYGFTGSSTNDWESVVEPARQLKELAAGLREKEDVSDEARVFAADNGYDLFSEEEIHKARFNLDQKELIKRFGTADGKAVETRLKVLATFEGNRQAFSPEQQNRFNEAFSNTAVQDEDVRSFAWLAKPVKRDIFGKVLKGYEENAAQNTAMLEDYISGDMEKKNRVLKDMAKDILSLDVSPEFFSEKNLTENTEAVISQMMKLFGFSNFYMGHLDFFTSNVFSDEERDELNRRIGGASNFSQLIVSKTQSYLGKLQLDGNGNTVQGFETFQNPASRQASFERLKQSADQYAKLQEELFAEALKEDKAAKETENKYGRQIRQVNHLGALERNKEKGVNGIKSLKGLYENVGDLIYKKTGSLSSEARKAAADFLGFKEGTAAPKKEKKKKGKREVRIDEEIFKEIKKRLPFAGEDTGVLGTLIDSYYHNDATGDNPDVLRDIRSTRMMGGADEEEEIRQDIRNYASEFSRFSLDDLKNMDENFVTSHFDELLVYRDLLRALPQVRKQEPAAYESLPLLRRLSLETRLTYLEKLESLIDSTLRMHWISPDMKDPLPVSKDKKALAREREASRESFNKALSDFKEAAGEQGLAAGLAFARGKYGSEAYDVKAFEEKLKANRKLASRCNGALDTIIAQYQKDIEEADGWVYELKALDEAYKSGRAKGDIREKLTEAGKKALESHRILEAYNDLVSLVNNESFAVTEETEKILSERNLTDAYGVVLADMLILKQESVTEEEYLHTAVSGETMTRSEEKKIENTDEPAFFSKTTRKGKETAATDEPTSFSKTTRRAKEAEKVEESRQEEAPQDIKKLYPMPELPKHKALVKRAGKFKYEQQTSNNCWCVAGTAMFNQLNALHPVKGKKTRYYKQTDFRGYVPKAKTLQDIVAGGLTDYSQELIDMNVEDYSLYAGKGKTRVGSIFEMADFFLEKRNDIAVNKLKIDTPYKKQNQTADDAYMDDVLVAKQQKLFLDEVKKGLDAGGYVSVLTSYVNAYGQSNAHYTTITGMDGARLRILNPSNGDYELTASVSDYIHKDMVAGRGGTVEINYLSKLDKPKELANEYAAQGLSYDEKTKRFSAPMTFESAQNAGQTLGVLVGRDVNEVERAQRSLYVPKQAG